MRRSALPVLERVPDDEFPFVVPAMSLHAESVLNACA
jgi:hypothetical protein